MDGVGPVVVGAPTVEGAELPALEVGMAPVVDGGSVAISFAVVGKEVETASWVASGVAGGSAVAVVAVVAGDDGSEAGGPSLGAGDGVEALGGFWVGLGVGAGVG